MTSCWLASRLRSTSPTILSRLNSTKMKSSMTNQMMPVHVFCWRYCLKVASQVFQHGAAAQRKHSRLLSCASLGSGWRWRLCSVSRWEWAWVLGCWKVLLSNLYYWLSRWSEIVQVNFQVLRIWKSIFAIFYSRRGRLVVCTALCVHVTLRRYLKTFLDWFNLYWMASTFACLPMVKLALEKHSQWKALVNFGNRWTTP